MSRDKLIWILGGLASLVIIVSGIWYYYTKVSAPMTYSNSNTSFAVLTRTNSDFAKGYALDKAGDYVGAIASYRSALAKAADSSQIGRINLHIAITTAKSGDRIGAIRLYKQVVANTAASPAVRAYAVEYMGKMYYGTRDTSITSEIFKDEPYKIMFTKGNNALSYRRLFEYGASIYPFAVSELYISNWYAAHLIKLRKVATSSPEIDAEMALIKDQLKKADADIAFMKSKPNTDEAAPIPTALRLKATTIEQLSYAGLASSTGAESAFKDSMAAYSSRPEINDGFARYGYARFLALTYGKKRIADIQALLKPLYTDPAYTPVVAVYFKNARVVGAGNAKSNAQALARLDPGFKTYLVSLGWEKTDF